MNRRIINNALVAILFISGLLSCSAPEKNLIRQKWKTIALNNPKMEAEFLKMQQYIDTVGTLDKFLADTVNIDSLKMSLQTELNQMKESVRISRDNTLMEFKSNGVVYMTSIDGTDSAMYELEKRTIKIDEAKLKGYGESMTFEILKITTDSLRLRLIDYGDTSEVTMVPVLD
ncbi:MAG: hypothetical protein IPI46_08255 [Bacteroidetes bacterium]|nr:hypothetical protein [Bacteroidota bacterium]